MNERRKEARIKKLKVRADAVKDTNSTMYHNLMLQVQTLENTAK